MNDQTIIEKRRAYDREWKRLAYLENPEKMRAIARAKYERIKADPDKIKRYKEYHKEYSKQYDKSYKQTEEYKVRSRKQRKEWYRKNAKRVYQQRREKPYEKLSATIRSRIYDYLKHDYSSIKTEELLGITMKELKVYLEKQFKVGMTWDNYGFYGWHADHIRPLCSFDFAKSEERKKAFHYTNLQPLWAKENMSKGGKYLIKNESREEYPKRYSPSKEE